MDPNTQKNLMGAAGAGEAAAAAGQEFMHGYYNTTQKTALRRFVVPDGVTSICACCIGAGEIGERSTSDADGGRGGDLRYLNDISVSPGDVLLLGAGTGFASDANGMDAFHSGTGKYSSVRRKTGEGSYGEIWEDLCYARGGANAGTNIGTGVSGSMGADGSASNSGGGGGAGGYTTSDDGQSANSAAEKQARMAGGVGVTGNNETPALTSASYYGSGGTYGDNWNYLGTCQGQYGGGGGGFNSDNGQAMSTVRSQCGVGATRIIWGEGRSYPSNAQGYFPTPPAGTQLEIRFCPPINYLNSIQHIHTSYGGIKLSGLEIIDDTDTNLVETSASGQFYNGIPVNTNVGSIDWDGVTDATPNGTIYDFDNISGSSGVVLNNIGGSSYGITTSTFKSLCSTSSNTGLLCLLYGDQDSGTYVAKMPSDADSFDSEEAGNTLSAPHENHFYTNSILIKFDSAKVIKKINFYSDNKMGWTPPLKILLDGNVIARDAAHFVDPPSSSYYSGNRMATFEFT